VIQGVVSERSYRQTAVLTVPVLSLVYLPRDVAQMLCDRQRIRAREWVCVCVCVCLLRNLKGCSVESHASSR